MAIAKVGKQTRLEIKEFQGVEGLDNKNDLLLQLTKENLGSTYMELSNNPTDGVKDIYTLNLDSFGVPVWYKL